MKVISQLDLEVMDDAIDEVREGVAVITSCLIKALDDIDDRIGDRFRTRPKESFEMLLNSGTSDAKQVRMLEMMSWVDELSGGNGYKGNSGGRFMDRGDQGKSFGMIVGEHTKF